MKISVRLSVLVVLVSFVLIVSLLLLYGVNNRFNDKILTTVIDDIENTVEVCKDELSNSILKVQRSQDLLGVNKDFINLLKTTNEDALERIHNINKLVEYADFLDTNTIEYVNGDFSYLFVDTSQPISDCIQKFLGKEIAPSLMGGNFASVGTNEDLERFEWYTELLEGEQQMYIFEQSNAPNYIFLAQVINNDLSYSKEMLAVSLVGIDFENILRSYRSINNKSMLEIMIVNDKGRVMCTSDESVSSDVAEFASRYYSDSEMSSGTMATVQINDVDYLKRHLVCEATLKVIERRLEQSKAIIFVESENSLNSIWCKYELNYFSELKRPIYVIKKSDIDNKTFELVHMKEKWFTDSNYKKLALIKGTEIKN